MPRNALVSEQKGKGMYAEKRIPFDRVIGSEGHMHAVNWFSNISWHSIYVISHPLCESRFCNPVCTLMDGCDRSFP
jgi:hypothetical protein